MSESREFTIEPHEAGTRLDHFLAGHVPVLSRSRLQNLANTGHILVNGERPPKPGVKLRAGDAVSLNEPAATPSETLPEAIDLTVLFEDDDLIVINKPPGLVVHPAVGHANGTLVNALLHHCDELSGVGGVERPGIVHRLDKDTSGCMVAAKNDLAHQSLSAQFAERDVTKIYLALAVGPFAKRSGIVDAPIGRHKVHRQLMSVHRDGKPARTSWRVLAELGVGTLVECTLHTGRTHQIRVHLKHLGHPLLGDVVYGKPAGLPRQMLHAWKLGFNHPRTGERLDFCAGLPADFLAAGVPENVEELARDFAPNAPATPYLFHPSSGNSRRH
jgi:23S rRNA pseudouridine1911/1915/1917 synthase